jgi:hypothetical protein
MTVKKLASSIGRNAVGFAALFVVLAGGSDAFAGWSGGSPQNVARTCAVARR